MPEGAVPCLHKRLPKSSQLRRAACCVVLGSSKNGSPQPMDFMYAMRSARSLSFFRPAKTILVPGMYFFGFTRYSNMCLSDQTMPEFLLASEYANPSTEPEARPKRPQSGGPCFTRPPFS